MPVWTALDVGALERLAQRRHLVLDLELVLGRDLVAQVLERALGLERQRLGLVAGLDLLAPLLVLLGVLLGVADHLVHGVLRRASTRP